MTERRSLVEGFKATPSVDPNVEKAFVFGSKAAEPVATAPKPVAAAPTQVTRVPLSSRVRTDLSAALKRASLERQLNNESPNSVQDILEAALEDWLKANSYL